MEEAARAAETAARASYGRLVATIARRTRDIAAAEDALSEAFAAALRAWPARGVPRSPEAWLLTAARRAAGKAHRRGGVAEAARATLLLIEDEMRERPQHAIPDDRLRLLFACAHPAIAPEARTPLMLQAVLGLDARRIGAAFLVPGPTMGQRLVRAKAKIRDAGIPWETPEAPALPTRLHDVLQAVYAAFGTGWDLVGEGDAEGRGLAAEAMHLARLTADLLPGEPEPRGLLALMLYAEARRPARRDEAGAYVPLSEQDRGLWLPELIIEAEGHLVAAARARRMGRFQAEAAVQSLHVQAPRGGRPDPQALATLYALLVAHHPSVGALVGQAVAVGEARGPRAGLDLLDALPPARVEDHQPYWAARFHLLREAGEPGAPAARDRAVALSDDPAVRDWLLAR